MKTEELKAIPLFSDLGEAALSMLSEVVEERSFADGDVIFHEGDEGDAVYFIIDGAVKIEKRIGDTGSESKTLAIITVGDFFGEMSLFDGKPRSAGTVAMGPTRVYRFGRGTFHKLVESDTAAATGLLFAIIKVCHQRIRSLNDKVVVYHEVGKAVSQTTDLSQLLDVIFKQLLKATGAIGGAILLKEEFSGRLAIRHHRGTELTPQQRDAIGEARGILGEALKNENALLIQDRSNDPARAQLEATGLEATSMIISPARVGQTLLGLIVLGHSEPNCFDLDDVNLCMSVGIQAGQAIVSFRHHEEDARRSRLGRQYVRF